MSRLELHLEGATLAKEVAEEEAWGQGDRLPLLPTTLAKIRLLLATPLLWLDLRSVGPHEAGLDVGVSSKLVVVISFCCRGLGLQELQRMHDGVSVLATCRRCRARLCFGS